MSVFPKANKKENIEVISHLPGQFEQLPLTDTWKIQASLTGFKPMSSAFPNEPNKLPYKKDGDAHHTF